jgi:hypothetical protein
VAERQRRAQGGGGLGGEGGHVAARGGGGPGPAIARPRRTRACRWRRKQGRVRRLTGGVPAIVRGSGGLNLIRFQIQTDSNQVQIVLNFEQSKNGLLELQKIKIKYDCEGFEERNTFSIGTSSDSK